MHLLNTIVVGFKEIWAHKMRSLLTMLGIILGVASLVAMAALTKGMENSMKETMIAMGGADKVLVDEADVPPEQEHLANEYLDWIARFAGGKPQNIRQVLATARQ